MRKNGRKKRKLERLKKEKKKIGQCILQMKRWEKSAKCEFLKRLLANQIIAFELKWERLETDIKKLESQIKGSK